MRSSRRLSLAGLLAAACAASGPTHAAEVKAGDLVVEQPWARATPGGASVGGGYVTILNRGSVPDRLVGGSLEGAAGFALHTMTTENGVMKMRPAGPLAIPPGGSLVLSPAGTHIMFTGLARGLHKGDGVKGTLVFEHAGTVPVTFAVEGIAARGPGEAPAGAGAAMPGMDMR